MSKMSMKRNNNNNNNNNNNKNKNNQNNNNNTANYTIGINNTCTSTNFQPTCHDILIIIKVTIFGLS